MSLGNFFILYFLWFFCYIWVIYYNCAFWYIHNLCSSIAILFHVYIAYLRLNYCIIAYIFVAYFPLCGNGVVILQYFDNIVSSRSHNVPRKFLYSVLFMIFLLYWGSCYSIFSFICMFCRSLFGLLYFFLWSLCCLFFDLRILITIILHRARVMHLWRI
jgi:hypothetical protein